MSDIGAAQVMKQLTRTIYLGPRAQALARELGYGPGIEGYRKTATGLDALTLYDHDMEAFIALCGERHIRDFK